MSSPEEPVMIIDFLLEKQWFWRSGNRVRKRICRDGETGTMVSRRESESIDPRQQRLRRRDDSGDTWNPGNACRVRLERTAPRASGGQNQP